MMFASVSRTCSNPATVAAMIRVNGLDAVLKSKMVSPAVMRQVREASKRNGFLEHRRMLAGRRRTSGPWPMLKAARAHGPECIWAAERRPRPARMVSALVDIWAEDCHIGEIARRHGFDVAATLQGMTRTQIRDRASVMGVDLDAALGPLDPNFAYDRNSPVQRRIRAHARVMKRTCRLFGVTPEQLRDKTRQPRELAVPRHFFAYWCKRLVKMSFPEIGRRLGGRDHTTALNSVQRWPECRDEARRMISRKRGRFSASRAEGAPAGRETLRDGQSPLRPLAGFASAAGGKPDRASALMRRTCRDAAGAQSVGSAPGGNAADAAREAKP